ncbi:MAG: hypothetical protein NZ651_05060 [Candidatus Bipolaricaulota bacterium]|nr:hypothetical protein [Candidatus Bipolaricaulota bacterium]MDW8127123.1 hypothetical protein [Candidatus Bipolaricaulota bacterium]
MTIELEVKSGELGYQPEPGAWVVKIDRFEVIPTRMGEAIRVWVTREGWPSPWGFVVSKRLSKKSRLGQLLIAAGFELQPGTRFSLSKAVGREVGVVVVRDARGFSRPSGFFPAGMSPF